MRGQIDYRRTAIALVAEVLLAIALIAMLPAMVVVFGSASGLDSPWRETVNVIGFATSLIYYAALFFGLPQFFLLWKLGVRSRRAYSITGIFAGWLLFYAFAAGSVVNEAAHTDASSTNALAAFAIAILDPGALLAAYLRSAGLLMPVVFGALGYGMSFLWPPALHPVEGGKTVGWYVRIFTGKPVSGWCSERGSLE